ncbi:MAG: PPOX class probable F420-dependent enzyme [Halieaceae bacterium]|jgi:PPOX class probable F420-dependent enzyme
MGITSLARANYLSLATFRKSGEVVATPVWFAEEDGVYYAFSAEDAGKMKRLRNSTKSRVAPCSVSGAIKGEWIETTARVLSAEQEQIALDALRRKYGWQMRLTDLGSKITGKFHHRSYIAISPSTDSI